MTSSPSRDPSGGSLSWRRRAGLAMGLAVVTGVVWFHFVFGWVIVIGDSMRPTYRSGDLLFVRRSAYRESDPQRGDIVVAKFRSDWIVKRIVALPGESVAVRDGVIEIDGQPMPESYQIQPGTLSIRRGDLSSERWAVLGDNRSLADSSLFYAVVPRGSIMGKVVTSLRWH
ncbi:MAG: signal peptidase I [Verrucomicrobiales bacterium]|nr:signal peptidase I [Verrucomicrobiales bacterium]